MDHDDVLPYYTQFSHYINSYQS